MATTDLEAACDKYLESVRLPLWGQGYDVLNPKRRKVAAAWLADQILNVMDVAEREDDD